MKKVKSWEKVEIFDIAPITAKLVDPQADEFQDMPLIAPDHIDSGSGRLLRISSAKEQGAISKKFFVKKGSVIYSKIRPYLQKAVIAPMDCLCSADMYPLDCNERVKPEYILYTLISNKFTDFANKQSGRTGIPKINREEMSGFSIPLPPLPEQRAIADILSTWDRAIDTTEKLIAAKEERLEGFAREIFQSTKNKNQRGWKPVVLSSILSEHRHISTGVEKVFSVSVHKGMVNQIEHLGRSFSSNDTSKYNRVHFGDIVYTKSPTGNFPLGIVKQSHIEEDIIVSPLYGVFTPENFDLGTILDFYFNSPTRSKNYLSPIIQKGAKNTIAITNSTFLSNQITLPTEPFLQREIAGFIRTSREEISLQKDILINYKQQKRGLMQKLLTGEWRIKGV